MGAWVQASQRESYCLIKYILSLCVCVCVQIHMVVYVCMHIHIHVCIWRPDVDIQCLT